MSAGLELFTVQILLMWQLNIATLIRFFTAVLLAPCGATAKHGNYYSGKFTFFKLEKKYLLAGVITPQIVISTIFFAHAALSHGLIPPLHKVAGGLAGVLCHGAVLTPDGFKIHTVHTPAVLKIQSQAQSWSDRSVSTSRKDRTLLAGNDCQYDSRNLRNSSVSSFACA